jgi:predicted metal-binding membrane protein
MIPGADPVLRRDRLLVALGLVGVVALAWVYIAIDAARMDGMPMPPHEGMRNPWAPAALVMTFFMWSVMMVGMMLPSAAPAILLYAGLVRKHRAAGSVTASAWIFTAGYLAVWTAFSFAATILQAAMEQARLLTPMLTSANIWLTAGLLIAAGIYQFLPVKEACLQKCRAPLQFFMFRWRPGAAGAFRMGAEHGAFCLGCCWALMLLLFTAGVMNLLWVALIAGFVLVEKLLPGGRLFGRITGAVLIGAGSFILLGPS